MDLTTYQQVWRDYQVNTLNRYDAICYFEQALLRQPKHLMCLQSLAHLHQEQETYSKALEYAYQALELVPDDMSSLETAVESHWKLNEHHKAYALLKSKFEAHPESANLHYQMAFFYFYRLGRVDQAFPLLEKALAMKPHHKDFWEIMLFMAYAVWKLPPEKLFSYYQQWGKLVEAGEHRVYRTWSNIPTPDKKLKVGFVGGDFRRHSAIHEYRILFHLFNRQQFEYYIYDTAPSYDIISQWFYERATQGHNVAGMSTDELVNLIQQDQIDILLDLSSHTHNNRLDVFARKPAPIQMTGRGYGSTSGLTRIDYRFTDHATTPPELESYNTEQLVFLPCRLFWTVDTLLQHMRIEPPPVLTNGFITFGYTNAPFKLNRFLIETWCSILKQVPQSRFQLKYYELDCEIINHYYIELFQQHGIESERLTFLGGTNQDEHYLFYNQVDIVLDSFPYNGGVSTMEALWMGRPVVVLADGTRSGACVLVSIGDTRLLAQTPEEYIQMAIDLSQNIEHMMDVNQNMRQRMLDSQLCNGTEMVQSTETIFRDVWNLWCLQKTEGRTILQQAQWAMKHSHWNEAENLFRFLLAQNPKHSQALHGLGLVSHVMGHTESAIHLLNDALMVTPTNPYIYLHLALIFKQLNQFHKALFYIHQALQIAPDLGVAKQILSDLGKQSEAI